MARAVARGVADAPAFAISSTRSSATPSPPRELPVAAGAGAEFMTAEVQRKAHLGDLDAAELEAADRVPLADRRPAVAAGRRAAAGPRLEHVPDEIAAGARVLALDRDAGSGGPSRPSRAPGQDAASALTIASTISFEGWLVHSVTGRPGSAQTMVPCLAITFSGRSAPSFFGISGSIR